MKRTAALLFLGVLLIFASLTPGAVGGMGYTGEELVATDQLISGEKVSWPRNGLTPLLVHAPFVAAAHLFGDGSLAAIDRAVAFEPVVATALIVTLIFMWIRRDTGDSVLAAALALAAAFGTLLWPYAYIGLETVQSLALLGAAYLALRRVPPTAAASVAFTLCAAVAVTAKSTGLFLLPAVLFLFWAMFSADMESHRRRTIVVAAVSLGIIIVALLVNTHLRNIFWANYGGNAGFVRAWMIRGPISFFLNLVSFLGSPNKGLIVFAPITIAALYRLPHAWRANRRTTIFALLVLGGLAGGFSLLTNWADETWGPRYLHAAVAPLVILLGISAVEWRKSLYTSVSVYALVVMLGGPVSALGALFYYGSLHQAANYTGQSTLEALQGDITWNHVKFNDRLMRIWIDTLSEDDPPSRWAASRRWFFASPPNAPPWKSVDLEPAALPQALSLRSISAPAARTAGVLGIAAFASGVGLLLAAFSLIRRSRRNADPSTAA